MKRQKMYVHLLLAFIALLAALYVFSRTLYVWSLPKVTLTFSREGVFEYRLSGKSTAENLTKESVYPCTAAFEFAGNIDYLYAGDPVSLRLPSIRFAEFGGEISDIHRNGDATLIAVDFSPVALGKPLSLKGGEDIEITIEKSSRPFACIVPAASVMKDGRGSYVLCVNQSEGAFGRIYTLSRLPVDIWAEKSDEMAIRRSDEIELPIVVSSDQAVRPGDQIRIFP